MNLDNDLALIKLKRRADGRRPGTPACLPDATQPIGSECEVSGWGETEGKKMEIS